MDHLNTMGLQRRRDQYKPVALLRLFLGAHQCNVPAGIDEGYDFADTFLEFF